MFPRNKLKTLKGKRECRNTGKLLRSNGYVIAVQYGNSIGFGRGLQMKMRSSVGPCEKKY